MDDQLPPGKLTTGAPPANLASLPLLPDDLFVGRSEELATLLVALDGAARGRGRIILIEGAAGIGKTHLAAELAERAHARGIRAVWGRCFEDSAAPPYSPWIDVIRALSGNDDPAAAASALGAGIQSAAEIVPALSHLASEPARTLSIGAAEGRHRLFDALVGCVTHVAATAPLLIVLDNLHCADRSSLRLLERLAVRVADLPLLIVGTCHELRHLVDHPLHETRGELARHAGFQTLWLGPWQRDDVGRFLAKAAGERHSGLVDQVHARTEGNPLFVLEVVRLLLDDPGNRPGTTREWRAQIPLAVRAVISRRLRSLSPACAQLISAASVVGMECEAPLLDRIWRRIGHGEPQALMEEALAAAFVEALDTEPVRYRFSHALVQEAIAAGMQPSRRNQLHGIVAHELETLYADRLDEHVLDLANHYTYAPVNGATDRVVGYLTTAAETALSMYANETAVDNYERALAVLPRGQSDERRAALLAGLARALLPTGREAERAISCLAQAYHYYESRGDCDRAVDTLELPEAQAFGTASTPTAEAVSALRKRVLARLDQKSHLAARLLYKSAAFEPYEVAEAMMRRALVQARYHRDRRLEARIRAGWSHLERSWLKLDSYREHAEAAIALAENVGESHIERATRHQLGFYYLFVGKPALARSQLEATTALEVHLRTNWFRVRNYHVQQSLCHLTGDWRGAREFIGRGLEHDPLDEFSLQNRAHMAYELDDDAMLEDTLRVFTRFVPKVRSGSLRLPEAGRLCAVVARVAPLADGSYADLPTVRDMARSVLEHPAIDPFRATFATIALCLIAVRTQDAELAASVDVADLVSVTPGVSPWAHVSVDRVLGLRAQLLGHHDEAVTRLSAAIDLCRAAGYGPEHAWACYDLAGVLTSTPRPTASDRDAETYERAVSLLERAAQLAAELQLTRLSTQVQRRRRQVTAAAPPDLPAAGPTISRREREVLRLVGEGKTNEQIATELFISAHTVGNHVSRILAKTGAKNRTEAALIATRDRLI